VNVFLCSLATHQLSDGRISDEGHHIGGQVVDLDTVQVRQETESALDSQLLTGFEAVVLCNVACQSQVLYEPGVGDHLLPHFPSPRKACGGYSTQHVGRTVDDPTGVDDFCCRASFFGHMGALRKKTRTMAGPCQVKNGDAVLIRSATTATKTARSATSTSK
jgi:hypothetical protein